MSLRLRVVVAIALLLLSASVVGTALAGWQANKGLRDELVAALAGGSQTVRGAYATLGRSDDAARDLQRLVAAFDGNRHLRASLIDLAGRTRWQSHPIPVTPAPVWFAALFGPGVGPVRLAIPPPVGGWIVLDPQPDNDVAAIWAEFVDLVTVLSVSLILGSGLMWLSVGGALRPLAAFSEVFQKIGSGDYSAKVREAGPPELARLGRGVNEMAGRLAAMQERTQRLEGQLRTLQDEERADLARDLHDVIGPHLFAVNVDAAMARRLIAEGRSDEAQIQVDSIQDAVGHMQRLVRDILGRLRPTELIELGLKAAVDELVAFWKARNPGITFAVKVPDDAELFIADEVREILYRVIQEGLNNAVRHGRPTLIEIEVSPREGGEILAQVTDDGAPSGKPVGVGFGLRGMRERVAAANGALTVRTDANGGQWTVAARLAARPGEDALDEADAA